MATCPRIACFALSYSISKRGEVRGCASMPGFECTEKFASMEEALAQIGRAIPDLALVDIGLPAMSGIEGVRL